MESRNVDETGRPDLRQEILETIALQLCQSHAAALAALAMIMLGDAEEVTEVVAEAIAFGSRSIEPNDVAGAATRQRLARSVFHRCRGVLVSRERFRTQEPASAASSFSALEALGGHKRAALALTTFGDHDLSRAAEVLDLTPSMVLRELHGVLAMAAGAASTVRTDDPPLILESWESGSASVVG